MEAVGQFCSMTITILLVHFCNRNARKRAILGQFRRRNINCNPRAGNASCEAARGFVGCRAKSLQYKPKKSIIGRALDTHPTTADSYCETS